MNCHKCNATINNNAKFCPFCGAKAIPESKGPVCTSCGTVNAIGAKFCKKCGSALPAAKPLNTAPQVIEKPAKPVNIVPPPAKPSPTPAKPLNSAPQVIEKPAKPVNIVPPPAKPSPAPAKPIKAANKVKNFNILSLVPAFLLAGLWFILSVLSAFNVNILPVRILSFLTYAKGGAYGGALSFLGGLLGKGVFAGIITSVLMALLQKRNPFKEILKGFKAAFGNKSALSLSSIGSLLAGAGAGLLAYWLFNMTANPVNSAIALAGIFGALLAAGSRRGIVFWLLGKFTSNKTKGINTTGISRFLIGVSAGFGAGFFLTFLRVSLLMFIFGLFWLIIGTVIVILCKNVKGLAAYALVLLVIGSALSPCFAISANADGDTEGYPYTDKEHFWGYSQTSTPEIDGNTWSFVLEATLRQNDDYALDVEHDNIYYSMTFPTAFPSSGPRTGNIQHFYYLSGDRACFAQFDYLINRYEFYSDISQNMTIWDLAKEYAESSLSEPAATVQQINIGGYQAMVVETGLVREEDIFNSGYDPDCSINGYIFIPMDDYLIPDSYTDRDAPYSTAYAGIIIDYSLTASDEGTMGGTTLYDDVVFDGSVSSTADACSLLRNDYNEFMGNLSSAEFSVRKEVVDKVDGLDVGNNVEVSESAAIETGEVEFTIPEDIVEKPVSSGAGSKVKTIAKGAASAAAAAIGGLAAAAGASMEAEEEKRKKKYALKVEKSFGDAIRRGAKPMEVRARIVEIDVDTGTEATRPDLTEKINITGFGINVDAPYPSGIYKAVAASVPQDSINPEGSIIFEFTGEGGSYKNEMKFKIVGECLIITSPLNVIGGDGKSYKTSFFFENAVMEPNSIIFKSDKYTVTYEKGESYYSYNAIINNNSEPVQRKIYEYADRGRLADSISIEADFANGEKVYGSISVTKYPEGISLWAHRLIDEMLVVDTLANEKPEGLDLERKPTSFELIRAYIENDTPVIEKVMNAKFDKLTGIAINSDKPSDKFDYEILDNHNGSYNFMPKNTLPQPDILLNGKLRTFADNSSGQDELVIPVCFLGEYIDTILMEWQDEVKKLKNTIKKFGLSNDKYIRNQIHRIDMLTPNEIWALRWSILQSSVHYYTREAQDFNDIAIWMGKLEVAFDWIKWITDLAFSYVATLNFGPTAECFLTPLKDLMFEYIGKLSESALWGTEYKNPSVQEQAAKFYLQGFENVLANKMGDAFGSVADIKNFGKNLINFKNIKDLDVKKRLQTIGAVCAGFLLINIIKRIMLAYDSGEKVDYWKIILGAIGDMTGNVLKSIIGNSCISMLSKNKFLRDSTSKFLNDNWSKHWLDQFTKLKPDQFNGVDIAAKYVSEFTGLVFSTVYQAATTDDKPFSINITEKLVMQLRFGQYVFEALVIDNINLYINIYYDIFIKPFVADCVPVSVVNANEVFKSVKMQNPVMNKMLEDKNMLN